MTERLRQLEPPLTDRQKILISDNRRFEPYVLRHYIRKYADIIDVTVLKQCIEIALIETARTYDENSGISFEHYARRKACWEIEEAARQELRHMYTVRKAADVCMLLQEPETNAVKDSEEQALGAAQGITERLMAAMMIGLASEAATTLAVKGENGAIEEIDHRNALRLMHDALSSLSELQRTIVDAFYGDPEQQLKYVAQKLRVSYRTVRREHRAALTELYNCLQA